MIKTFIAIILICGLSLTDCLSQYPSFIEYNSEGGLPSDEVYDIIQDNDGMIWIGCESGLYLFDGFRFIPYTCESQRSKSMTNLELSPDGNVYCINFKGQVFYTKENQLKELKSDSLQIKNILFDRDGTLYAAHNNGLSKYDKETWSNIYSPNQTNSQVHQMLIDQYQNLTFLTFEGIGVLRENHVDHREIKQERSSFASEFMYALNKDSKWLFSIRQNTYYFVNQDTIIKNKSRVLHQTLQNRKLTKVVFTNDSTLWIGTYKGIIRYDVKKDEARLYYADKSISDIMIDREGNYWFTTLQSGILKVPNINFLVWNNTSEGEDISRITHLENSNEKIFFTTINGKVGVMDNTSLSLSLFDTGINANIESMVYDTYSKSLILFTKYQLLEFDGQRFKKLPQLYSSIKKMILIQDDFLIATSTGLYHYTRSGKKTMLNTSWCRDLFYSDTTKKLYVATNEGVLKYHFNNNTFKLADTLLRGIQSLSLSYNANDESIFALSFENIIYSIKEEYIDILTKIPPDIQSEKTFYHEDKIYITSNQGLLIYNLTSKNFFHLDRRSGLASNNVQDVLLKDHFIWLATGKGIQRLPEKFRELIPKAKVNLRREVLSPIQLDYEELLVLYPSASNYTAEGNFKYAYSINNKSWVTLPGNIEKIEIQGIPSGKFNLRLKVMDHLGRDSENTITVEGSVTPAIWWQWWFLVLIGVTVIIISLVIIRVYIRNIRKKARQKNLLLNSQLKAIRAQMNPHFMYNTLNSIQDLILQNDIKNTNYYLTQFSQLMRQILTFSEKESLLLEEEINMLENYLSLEKLRFGDEFSYDINIDPDIQTDEITFPSLIIQPFVENAIKHGLLHLKGQKELMIHFAKQGKQEIVVTITDNGIGRKRAGEIRDKQRLNHQSFASNAVKRRMELLNKGQEYAIDISISNAFNIQKNVGTRVVITIHYNEKAFEYSDS
ncbi:MAG: histidine kinase [Brumimicrobium sp.]|nr:histidine kinase [Brumimicrobium sp.]